MPGTPESVVGSDPATGIVAVVLAGLVLAGFLYAASRWDGSAAALAGVGAIGYGLFAAGVWAGVRLAFHHLTVDPTTEPVQFAWLLILAGSLLAVQAAIPFFLYARFRFVLPMVGFAGISAFLFLVFLYVGGESDPLPLFGVGFAPLFLGSLLALGALEAGVRYVAD